MTNDNCPIGGQNPAYEPSGQQPPVPNTGVGGIDGTLPPNPPTVGPGPIDAGIRLDQSPPNYAGNYPRMDLDTFDEYCQALPTFKMIQGLIFTVLANHFSNAANIISPTLRQYTWDGNSTNSSLVINIEEDWDPQVIGRKPAIYLSRQDVVVQKLAINDQEQGTRLDGKTFYDIAMVGSHVIKCYGLNSFQPDDLAFETATLLARVAPAIRNYLGLIQLRVATIGKKEKLETDPQEAYFVPIVVPWAFQYRWNISPAAPVIQFIDLSWFS